MNPGRGPSGTSPEQADTLGAHGGPRLRPYHIEDAAGPITLDAMENPHPWPAELR